MCRKPSLFAAALLVSLAATTASADPVFSFAETQENSANPHFGSKLLMEAGLSRDAGLHLGWAKNRSFNVVAPSVDFMSAPSICVQAPAVAAPEPATMILLGTGLIGAGAVVRRALRNKKAKSPSDWVA